MLRKKIIPPAPAPTSGDTEARSLDIAAVATLLVTSESPEHPIDNVFDQNQGPGGTRWIANQPGEQTIILAFDVPQTIHEVAVEFEEMEVSRTQELQLAISQDEGRSYREVLRQEYNFSPPGTTFERESWAVCGEGVTHLRLMIKPDKGGQPCRASLTSLVLR